MNESENDQEYYGFLEHPSGIVLPKLLRSSISSSLHPSEVGEDNEMEESRGTDGGGDMIYLEKKDRYWDVKEIVHTINETSQQLLNVQSQILNGEDFYVNNLSSISIYNTKNVDASFLDSRNDYSNATTMGSSTATGMGSTIYNNHHRWFSGSLTDLSPYQRKMQLPVSPKKIHPVVRSSTRNATTTTTLLQPTTTNSSKLSAQQPQRRRSTISSLAATTVATPIAKQSMESSHPSTSAAMSTTTNSGQQQPATKDVVSSTMDNQDSKTITSTKTNAVGTPSLTAPAVAKKTERAASPPIRRTTKRRRKATT
jgi:hypothetical protein